ncbi:RNA/RNP complex-1-interacting phosphatase-like isoform X3 [Branchiostoma floridae]|uniref:RNA/RNP complex-1-interacting phosphatase-like isoform X3 n=1 Tax=Branchiostoma floridae TaxID=7739 RepID=A0A9J7L1M2_BRAFL|nr:RNA/RNP complex-1-interacting phosphatase-like isoform X3 [Branchiostoma floridae]
MPPRSIPDRWLDYSPMGRQMEGTRFISFKVPLKVGICSNLPSEDSFTVPDMIQGISDQGGRLGLVIDLTFTTRYYNKQDIIKAGIKYEKIFTAGKEVPSDDVVQEFASIVHNFETENKDDSLIGVHCTHGVNRTGYLVCRYLIDYKHFTAEKAIAAFNKARGHDLERENYLEHLQQRSALVQSGEVKPPKLPLPRKQGPTRERDQPPSRERRYAPYDQRRRDRHRSGGSSSQQEQPSAPCLHSIMGWTLGVVLLGYSLYNHWYMQGVMEEWIQEHMTQIFSSRCSIT